MMTVKVIEIIAEEVETRMGMTVEFRLDMPYNAALRKAVSTALDTIQTGTHVLIPISSDVLPIAIINLDTLDVTTT